MYSERLLPLVKSLEAEPLRIGSQPGGLFQPEQGLVLVLVPFGHGALFISPSSSPLPIYFLIVTNPCTPSAVITPPNNPQVPSANTLMR